jgi:hypothetical protein
MESRLARRALAYHEDGPPLPFQIEADHPGCLRVVFN